MFVGIIHFLDYLLEKEKYFAGHPLFIFLPSLLREGPWYSSGTQWGTPRTMPHPPTLLAREEKFGAGMGRRDESVPIILLSQGYSGCRVFGARDVACRGESFGVWERPGCVRARRTATKVDCYDLVSNERWWWLLRFFKAQSSPLHLLTPILHPLTPQPPPSRKAEGF